MKHYLWTGLAICIGITTPQRALGASIGIYSTADATGHAMELRAGEQASLYVIANPTPGVSWGGEVSVAEYRIIGLPEGWVASWLPTPLVLASVGDPFGAGVDIALANSPGAAPFLLHTLSIRAATDAQDVTLEVVARNPPGGPVGEPPSDCPWLHYISVDHFEVVCAEVEGFRINSATGLKSSLWYDVKRLYRE